MGRTARYESLIPGENERRRKRAMRDDYRSGILLDNTVGTPELNVYQPLNKSPAIPNSKVAYKPVE